MGLSALPAGLVIRKGCWVVMPESWSLVLDGGNFAGIYTLYQLCLT